MSMNNNCESNSLVRGLGIKGVTHKSTVDGLALKEYGLWSDMLRRCTMKGQVKNKSYIGCKVSDNFKSYSYFYEWCNSQVGFGNKDEKGKSWCLDKDILFKGNKTYSEYACCFVPEKINKLLTGCKGARGSFPVGVYFEKFNLRFRARCAVNGKYKHLGYFQTCEQAFEAYKTFKEALIKQVANEYKEQLDEIVYQALMKYTVEITD